MLQNPALFYDSVRSGLFRGHLSVSQFEGIERLLKEADRFQLKPINQLSYILATSYHETGARMQPVREGFASSDAAARKHVMRYNRAYASVVNGNVYYGRGDVQLTWADNYRDEMRELVRAQFGVDIYHDPDMVLKPEISAFVLFEGMMNGQTGVGDFTKYSLEYFVNDTRTDYVGARRVVNGTDKAEKIAGYARAFQNALQAGGWHIAKAPKVSKDNAALIAALAALATALGLAFDVDVTPIVDALNGINAQ